MRIKDIVGATLLFTLALSFFGCGFHLGLTPAEQEYMRSKVVSSPSAPPFSVEQANSCIGDACKDVPIQLAGSNREWTNRGVKVVLLKLNYKTESSETVKLGPGSSHSIGTKLLSSYEATYEMNKLNRAETSITHYDEPSNCVITPFSSGAYIRLYFENRSGGKGEIIGQEFFLSKEQHYAVKTYGGRLVYDYRYDTNSAWNTDNHTWCHRDERIWVP